MTFKDSIRSLQQDPFAFFDNINLTIKGNNLNIFQKYKRLQRSALLISIFCAVAWILCGFDSTPLQFVYILIDINHGLLAFIQGHATYANMIQVYNSFYGKEMHWSAFVIYMGMFWILSKHFSSNFNIVKSKNVAYAASITFLSIAMFEFYWMYSFAFWQNQWWVVTWQLPQLRILLQNVAFASVGIIGILYMWMDSYILKNKEIVGRTYHFNIKSAITIGLCITTVALALLWWYYPWTTQQQISVTLLDGNVWYSNIYHFPQTLYTIKTDSLGSINAGEWFWVEDNAVHALNTILKFAWAAAIASIFMIQKITNNNDEDLNIDNTNISNRGIQA